MSRVGKKPVVIPSGVTAELKAGQLKVAGPKGTLTLDIHPLVQVAVSGNEITANVGNPDNKKQRSLWGLHRALIQNLMDGVVKGYEKKLEVNGVGFKLELTKAEQAMESYKRKLNEPTQAAEAIYAVQRLGQLKGPLLEMRLGFSHPVFVQIPADITVTIEKNVITITGPDRQRVGQFAAEVRELKKPEPYKGKGIRYIDEVVRRKAGKVVKVVGGGK